MKEKDKSIHRPLHVCLLSYRSNPHSGGQGVYVANLARALTDLGHHVDVISGPPDLPLDPDIGLVKLPCLDLYHPEHPFRMPSLKELSHPVHLLEWVGVSTMGFPEPMTFGIRAWRFIRMRRKPYDIIHDNQSLSYGLWAIQRRYPTVATIHHPITVDRHLAIRAAEDGWRRLKEYRWYSFIGMQRHVARTLARIITVSHAAKRDIARAFAVDPSRMAVVPNGIDARRFRPLPGVRRDPCRLIVTNSADTALKGLPYLLKAVADIAARKPIKLVVIGKPKENGEVLRLVAELQLADRVTFTGRVDHEELVRQYARASIAVVPSVYEGFGLPAGEAMACGLPVVSTTGGALPEVVGAAGVLVPTGSSEAIRKAVETLLENPERARALGRAGFERVHRCFTWKKAAEKTVEIYREVLLDYRML